MNALKLRKILLLSAIAVLTVIYALQLIYQRKNAVRDETLKQQADTIEVTRADKALYRLKKEGDNWLLSSENLPDAVPADSYAAEAIKDAVQKVRILGKVGSAEDAERFGLDTADTITVKALKDDKTLRTIRVGKAAGTSMQSYITLDDAQTVLLASGDLNGIFTKTEEELKASEPEADTSASGVEQPQLHLNNRENTEKK